MKMITIKRGYLLIHLNKNHCLRSFSIQNVKNSEEKYKLVIIGAGTGGCATGSKFARKLGAENVAIIEPSQDHCIFKIQANI